MNIVLLILVAVSLYNLYQIRKMQKEMAETITIDMVNFGAFLEEQKPKKKRGRPRKSTVK